MAHHRCCLAMASAAITRLTRSIRPHELQVIQPPDLWNTLDRGVDAQALNILELVKEHVLSESAVLASWTAWCLEEGGVLFIILVGRGVVDDTSGLELANWAQGIASDSGGDGIEGVTAPAEVLTDPDLSGSTVLSSDWEVIVAGDINILGHELQEQWWGLWNERDPWWWTDNEAFREVEVLVGREDRHWIRNVDRGSQGWNLIELKLC